MRKKYGINPLLIFIRFVFSINFLEANFLKKGDYHYEEKVYIYHDADVCYYSVLCHSRLMPLQIPVGNKIDWEEDYGYEDAAGSEILKETEIEESTEYSFSEQVKVLEQMQQYETTAPAETGYVAAALQTPSRDWSESNIRIILYDGSRKEEFWLYRQNDWSARQELPVGLYTIAKAETADGSYKFTATPSTFDLGENASVPITLTLGASKPKVEIPDDLAHGLKYYLRSHRKKIPQDQLFRL